MKRFYPLIAALTLVPFLASAAETVTLPSHPYFVPFSLDRAPHPSGLQLKAGDRLAICGDSITEQKMYSRIMETYLTVCVPQLEITVRQFGWSGERAPGFQQRMANDVLRFNPTIATTCYGMNDHRYQPFTEEIGKVYRESSEAIITAFKEHGVRVIQGAPGTIGKMPSWVRSANGTVLDLNLGLMELRNIDVALANTYQTGFADVYQWMLVQGFAAKQNIAEDYMLPGKDGVHPGWAGQLVMAYSFLEAMGLDGEIGSVTLDLTTGKAETSEGHEVTDSNLSSIQLVSHRYPFCATGELDSDNSIRSGMTLVPFNQNLNRFSLKAKNLTAKNYRVTWGDQSQTFSRSKLSAGINLADAFHENPFTEAFNRVDKAVGSKQAYETRQIKTLFHGPEGKTDPDLTARLSESVRTPLAKAIRNAFQPVTHTITIEPI
ncbi:SGNH/GDSL hydrolase family protein [Verrucomicrobia bacterium]|jgi:lysophospholipase L1-like esterase|nr:SGNH/GDSL hydrolase family protein [Verrucomicrobiota bacterium]